MRSTSLFDVHVERELFVVRWRASTVEATTQLTQVLRERHAEVGAPLFYVALIGADNEPPDEQGRAAILDGLDQTYELIRTARVVLLGSSLRLTLIRSGLAAMTLVAGFRGRRFYVDKTLRDTARHYEEQLGRPAREFLDFLVTRGVVTPEELG